VRQFGLVRSHGKLCQYRRWHMPELSGFMYPDALGADLDVAVDALGWFTLLDDQFDGFRRTRTGRLRSLRNDLIGCLESESRSTSQVPIVSAWSDVCARMRAGMPEWWLARNTEYWRTFLDACMDEEFLSTAGSDAVDRYLATRMVSGAGYIGVVLLERTLRCALSGNVWHAPPMPLIRRSIARVALFANDFCSVPREAARLDQVNLVTLLQIRHGYSRSQALSAVAEGSPRLCGGSMTGTS
jgi:pentalenene synthase